LNEGNEEVKASIVIDDKIRIKVEVRDMIRNFVTIVESVIASIIEINLHKT